MKNFNDWFSYRVNKVSFLIALIYWIFASMALYELAYVRFNDLKEPFLNFPEWLYGFLSPGYVIGGLSIFYGGYLLVIPLQIVTLILLVLFIRIIMIFFFALFGWDED